ncbi:MAG: acyl carrier protein [Lachnospiraceae bacterium]|nr:acyl carrier protein [Lachnospiraceae bacterium]
MLEKVINIIKETLNVEGMEITEDTNFKDDIGADSLDLYELLQAFDDEFGVGIPEEEEELEKLATVGDIVEYLKSKGVEA